MRRSEITRSSSGIPCMWESGGSYTNTGNAQIITDCNGNPKRALYVRTHGDLACGYHALIPVRVGDCVLTVSRHRDKYDFINEKITAIEGESVILEEIHDPICIGAYNAALDKVNDYHCRRPYYIREKQFQWYQEIAGDGSQTALVTVGESVYRMGYRDQQLEYMVFGTCHNLVFECPKPQHIDFEVHFFINADGNLEKEVREV